jgi:thioredoxin reductase
MPIGLEAALYAAELGYDVTIFDKDVVGANILKWGHVRLFSPWKLNHSTLAAQKISQNSSDWHEPDDDAYLTGYEFVHSYLQPLSRLPQLADAIHTGVEVEFIGRHGILKGDYIGNPERKTHAFRLLTKTGTDKQEMFHADIVIDASGVYGNHNWLGDGGIPAMGEQQCENRIEYQIPDIYGRGRKQYAGKRTLLVGSGYSAATVACDLQNLIKEEPDTSLIWAIRHRNAAPLQEIADDPLPNRADLTRLANQLAGTTAPQVQFHNSCTVESVDYSQEKHIFTVALNKHGDTEQVEIDNLVAMVGYGPENSIYRELQVHECYASRGPMKLAAALLGEGSADCLAQQSFGADTLINPEPNFYIIGNKSYGRNPTFLLRVGLAQIVELFSVIDNDPDLNLYHLSESRVT